MAHTLSNRLAKTDAKDTAGTVQTGADATLEEAKNTAASIGNAAQDAATQAKVCRLLPNTVF